MTKTSDCYSAKDRKMMLWWAKIRARSLTPFLAILSRLGITANGVTLVSLIFGLCFAPLFFVSPAAALVCLWLHVLIDGLDGPLARFRGTASAKGSLTDTVCDQVIVAVTTGVLIYTGYLDGITGGFYLFSYTLVVAFSMIRNALTVPYGLVLRPRFIVYAWLIVELYLWPDTLNVLVRVLLIPLIFQAYRGYRAIRNKL